MASKSKNKIIIVYGIILICIGMYFIYSKWSVDNAVINEEKNKINEFYEKQEVAIDIIEDEEDKISQEEIRESTDEDYIAVVKIPKIKLERGLYSKENLKNNIDTNIQILDESSYPNIENGNFILAAHAGTGRISYFKDINKLELDDEIEIIFNGNVYKYKVVNTYEIEKTGTANIKRNNNVNTLTLITCIHNTNYQLIVICELVSVGDYNGEQV